MSRNLFILPLFNGGTDVLAKILIVLALLGILYALGSAFFLLLRDKGEGKRTLRRLTWRVLLSLLLFLAIMLAVQLGWVRPGGINPVQFAPAAPGGND